MINNLRIIAEDLPWARRHRNTCDLMTKYRALDAVFRGDRDVDELCHGVLEGLKPYKYSSEGTGPRKYVRNSTPSGDLAGRVAPVLEF